MTLSIVVTTYNRSKVLRDLVLGLESQTDPDFQVVVAIDGSTDDTESMLADLRVPFDLKWVNTHCTGYGLAVARNMGILASDRRAVSILDDDSFPVADYVAAHKRTVTAGVITGGPRQPADAGNERMAWKMRELGRLPPLTPMSIPMLRREWPNAYLIENNICMLREDFIAMGLFNERIKLYGFIGQEFFGRSEYLGLKYQYNPAAAVLHHGEIAGDNGFSHRRKERETRLAGFLRPSVMRPNHYRAQVAWAAGLVRGTRIDLPPYRLHAALMAPWRAVGLLAMSVRRAISGLLQK